MRPLVGWAKAHRAQRGYWCGPSCAFAHPTTALHPGDVNPLSQQRLDLSTQRRRDVIALQCVGDIGSQKTDLAAAIEAAAFEFEPVEWLLTGEPDHRIGDLDFAAGAPGLV